MKNLLNNTLIKEFNAKRLEQAKLSTIEGKTKRGKTVDKMFILEVINGENVLESHKISPWKGGEVWTDLFAALEARYPALPEGSIRDVELWDIDTAMNKLKALTKLEETKPCERITSAEIRQTLLQGGTKLCNGTVKVIIKHEGGKGYVSQRLEYVAYISTPRFNTVYKTPGTIPPKGLIGFVDDLSYWLVGKLRNVIEAK